MTTYNLAYVVEDDYIASITAEFIVKKHLLCREVQQFANGQEAFERLAAALRNGEALPDLILLDLNMPLMDGWEFLDAFARLALPREVCVFVLTSSIYVNDIQKSGRYPAVSSYFSKPLSSAHVQQMRQLLAQAAPGGH